MISQTGATPLIVFGLMSLVAGNVTGGGGKATKQKPNGTDALGVNVKRKWIGC